MHCRVQQQLQQELQQVLGHSCRSCCQEQAWQTGMKGSEHFSHLAKALVDHLLEPSSARLDVQYTSTVLLARWD